MNKINNNEITANINCNSQSRFDNQPGRIVRRFGKLFTLIFAVALIVSVSTFSPVQAQETSEISTSSQTSFSAEEQKECKDKTWLEALYEFFWSER